MTVDQTPYFKRSHKRLHANQIKAVNNTIRKVLSNPLCGEEKRGDLAVVRVYKFTVLDQQFLLAYEHNKQSLFLLALGAHENFYRGLK
jgi:hypothetical protein